MSVFRNLEYSAEHKLLRKLRIRAFSTPEALDCFSDSICVLPAQCSTLPLLTSVQSSCSLSLEGKTSLEAEKPS